VCVTSPISVFPLRGYVALFAFIANIFLSLRIVVFFIPQISFVVIVFLYRQQHHSHFVFWSVPIVRNNH
jgi:hypothetical protein